MKRMQLVSEGTLSRLRHEAQTAFEIRNLPKCLEILERMNRLRPADPEILVQLGRLHGLLFDFASAEKWFERAVQVTPAGRKAETLENAGQQARDFAKSELAEIYLKRASVEKDVVPETFIKLAEFCERRRRTDEAKDFVDRALSLDPHNASALFARAHLQYRSGQLDEAERNLRSIIAAHSNSVTDIRAWYELGAILDRQGRYDEAMAAFLKAKEGLRAEGASQFVGRQLVWRMVAEMREQISPEILERWRDSAVQLPTIPRMALLGGHPRSGTTLLEQVLDAHPDIVSVEETDYFSDCVGGPLQRNSPPGTPIMKFLGAATNEILAACRKQYVRTLELHLGAPIGKRVLIDKNPSLTMRVQDIARALPEMKQLIALRDPRDVVLSCFMQPFIPVQQVSSTYLSLETAADEYVALMGTWRTVAPMLPNGFMEVRYEDMVHDLELVARRVLAFLDVTWDKRVLDFDEHARQKRVRSPTYADVTQKIFTRAVGRWRRYEKYLEPYLAKLEPFAKAFGYE